MSLPFSLNFTNSTYEYINGYYVIKFQNLSTTNTNVSGNITFLKSVSNLSIICVGGGGAGANQSGTVTTGGGGGGGSGTITTSANSGNTFNIIVGYGGKSGGNSGTSSSVSFGVTTIINCTGGSGGTRTAVATAGTMTVGGSGGSGGDGGYNNDSQNSWGSIDVPTELQSSFPLRYGGGGGFGFNSGGFPGNSGFGGSNSKFYAQNTNQSSAPNASSNGSGGGGGGFIGGSSNFQLNYPGGSGANGIVIMYFQYLYYKIPSAYTYTKNNVDIDAGLAMPIGSIVAWVNTTAPSGWALCNGATYNTTDNPILFNLLGSSNLPDLRGAFLRQAGTNVGTYASYSGPSLQNYQLDSFKTHDHTINDPGTHIHDYKTPYQPEGNINASGTTRGARLNPTTTQTTTNTKISLTIQDNSTDTETSPYCYGVNWIIKLDY